MKKYIVKIKSIDHVTHDVLRIVTEKPANYDFSPGQATDISINKNEWRDKRNPFTFTSLPSDDDLEFTIKTYPSHEGMTNELLKLKPHDEFILHKVFGAIQYQGEGTFIAGGAGVTPFISIFRDLDAKNKIGRNQLIFANKTKEDIILEEEFEKLLGPQFINILSKEDAEGYAHGLITKDFIKDKTDGLNQFFYLCGPEPMLDAMEEQLNDLQVDKKSIIKEAY